MKYHITAFIIGFILDQLIGDPEGFPHPIRLIGGLIAFLDKKLLNIDNGKDRNYKSEEKKGLCLCIIVIAVTAVAAAVILFLAYYINTYFGIAVEAVLTCYILAAKSLRTESMKVYHALMNGSIEEARQALSMIVGRDTKVLDENGIIRAAVETVAENTSDAVIAPLIYTFIGGPVLGFVYKAVNTMDSMVGYHNERFEYFGKAAARLDDIMNFIPARISAVTMIIASYIGGRDFSGRDACRIFRRDRYNHRSPNSAQTESVCAGALRIRLAGDAVYFGQTVHKPYIGDPVRDIEPEDIIRSCRLMYMTGYICVLFLILCSFTIHAAGAGRTGEEQTMLHGGEIYDKEIERDLSVSLNPYPVPEQLREVLTEAVTEVDRYPDITQMRFRNSVAKAHMTLGAGGITADNIIGANGASELIFAIVHSLAPQNVLIAVPGFYGYRHALNAQKSADITEHYLKEEDGFALGADFADKIDSKTDLVIIANPNNPTGRSIDDDILESIIYKCAATDTKIMIDESFLDLSTRGISAVKYIGRLKVLYIVNAYTKLFSIPGLRVGYAVSSEENILRLRGFLPEWNMSLPAQRVGEACAKLIISTDFIQRSKALIETERRRLTDVFIRRDCRVYPSDTCFILLRTTENLYEKYLKENILIRDCSNFTGLGKGYYRIAVDPGFNG